MSSIPRAAGAEAATRRHAAMRKPKAPQANRARMVAAATDEFAARGFKGASMDAIAARTHTTRALINYYFGANFQRDMGKEGDGGRRLDSVADMIVSYLTKEES